jgi:DNA modification methylase
MAKIEVEGFGALKVLSNLGYVASVGMYVKEVERPDGRPAKAVKRGQTWRLWGAAEFHAADVGNVIRCDRVGRYRKHETEKPADLVVELARVVCPAGGMICDPFMGSGTTGVACARLGLRFVWIELSPKHFDTACRRIEEAQRQGQLFSEPPAKAEQIAMFDAPHG